MRILVTGGAGFIGSHVCERLLGQGHAVVCLDNFMVGTRKNIKHLVDEKQFELIERDVEQPIPLKGIEQIYHLACPASPIHYQKEPLKTLHTIVQGTINALELAHRENARIVIASTSEVYGDPLEHPQKETYWGNVNPVGDRSCYDEGKRCAETYALEYKREKKVDVGIVRIFNTYGPRMNAHDGRAVPEFVTQAISGRDVTVFGDGSHTRSMQYIDDLVEGLFKMMEHPGLFGPINLGNPDEEHSMTELAQVIIELSGSKSAIAYTTKFPADDPARRRPDITQAKNLLGWQPKVGLAEGLEKTIDWFRSSVKKGY